VTADPELGEALARVRAATGTREPDATLLRRLAVEGAEAELEAGRNRRVAAEALFEAMDSAELDLDLDAVDRLNALPASGSGIPRDRRMGLICPVMPYSRVR